MVYIPDDDSIISEVGLMNHLRNEETSDLINNNNLSMKEHIKSFVITFVVAFAVVLVSNIDTISLSTLESGAIFGILFGAIRAGVKAILELVITKFS